MKTKRRNKKNNEARRNSAYTPGRNVFGEKAETHLVILKRETAFQQMMDCICQLDGSTKEFTFDMRCFDGYENERAQVLNKVQSFLEMKARIPRKLCYDCSEWMTNAS